MTREEARQVLATWLVSSKGTKEQRGYIEGWFDKEDEEAFRMAIEALQFQDIMVNNPKTANPTPEVCKNCKDNDRPHEPASDDLIIKGAKGIQDGLYNIQNGELFKYKATGGTVRTYSIVDALQDDWIPVSEGLPKEKQEVYVTVYFSEGDTGRAYGYIDGFGNWHLYSTVEGTLNSGYEVPAWMPLPKPYKAESEEV